MNMTKFRLKKEAVPFFRNDLATSILSYDIWEKHNIDMNALEEVEPVHITYGHKDRENTSMLSGWGNGDGSYFHFTLHFPSSSNYEHAKFTKGRFIRELMSRIQSDCNNYFSQFLNEQNP